MFKYGPSVLYTVRNPDHIGTCDTNFSKLILSAAPSQPRNVEAIPMANLITVTWDEPATLNGDPGECLLFVGKKYGLSASIAFKIVN